MVPAKTQNITYWVDDTKCINICYNICYNKILVYANTSKE